ncbi:ABC transporter substrate-binding protein [Bacteriovorax sp. PP10]|uniref:ABC transporter substrate-binding protein n=1 Tax=Bacteriovorax antarcticus TaxID=3088717 RepID=A0ABU5W0T9_9BACT|nr:ABC transporter substrate-binding protein [Bacteriovorax sp. PP10]MEA9358169.1 ABC transporter substrate-binding protein [Bacteriovorax sp. PP10]
MIIFLLCSNLRAAETVTLLAGESFPPLMWEDNGVAKGIAVEIGKAILVKAGYNVIVKTCPWKRCQVIAKNEGAFITGFSKNDERLKNFIYTDAIMYDDLVIVTKKGKEFAFDETKECIGKRIGAQLGVGFGQKNQGLKKGMIIETDSNDVSRVRKIMYGRIDGGFFSLGKAGIVYSAKLAGYSMDNFSILPVVVSKDPNYLATGIRTSNASEKIKKINAAIKVLTYNGTIAKVMKTTF